MDFKKVNHPAFNKDGKAQPSPSERAEAYTQELRDTFPLGVSQPLLGKGKSYRVDFYEDRRAARITQKTFRLDQPRARPFPKWVFATLETFPDAPGFPKNLKTPSSPKTKTQARNLFPLGVSRPPFTGGKSFTLGSIRKKPTQV